MSIRWRWNVATSLSVLAALCCLLWPTASLRAQGDDPPTVTLSEQTLAFRGLAGESLQRTFVLAVQGQPIHNVSLAWSDLVDAASGAVVLSSAMVVDPASQAQIDGEQRFAVTIGGAGARAGTYRGQLSIWYDERPAGSPLTLSLEAVIGSVPAVDVDVSSKNRTLAVRAPDWLPYVGRPTGDPQSPVLGQVPIYLVQKTTGQAEVQAATMLTMSGPEGQALPADVVRVDTTLPLTLTDQDAQALRVVVSGRHLPAGEYNGTLLVRIRNQANPLEIPLRLQIKHGPVFPLLILALSLLIGIWISLYNTRGLANMAVMKRIRLLDRRITQAGSGLQHNERAEGAQRLEQAVDALLGGAADRSAADRGGVEAQLDGVDQYVKGIEEAAAKVLEDALTAIGRAREIAIGRLVCAQLISELEDLRRQVRAGALTSLAEAQASLKGKADRVEAMAQIAADVAKLPEAARQAAQDRLDQAASLDQVKQIVEEMARQPTSKEPTAAAMFAAAEGHGFSYALDILRAGSGEAVREKAQAWNRFELKTRLGDLLGKAILYVFALLVGWTTLYLAAPTFGAKPEDYIALFLWGAAANVVSGQSINLASIWQKRRTEGETSGPKPEG
jgi:hypothetical protein